MKVVFKRVIASVLTSEDSTKLTFKGIVVKSDYVTHTLYLDGLHQFSPGQTVTIVVTDSCE